MEEEEYTYMVVVGNMASNKEETKIMTWHVVN